MIISRTVAEEAQYKMDEQANEREPLEMIVAVRRVSVTAVRWTNEASVAVWSALGSTPLTVKLPLLVGRNCMV